ATSGFGLETARALAGAGASVIITGRRQDRLEALKNELGSSAHALAFDVRDKAAVEAAFAGKHIDILVNNAGLALGAKSFEEQDMADLQQMVDTNVLGLIYCTHAILPGMVARGSGHIVNIGSIAGSYPYPGGNVYGGTKAFVTQFSLNLRADLVAKNVRVTSIEPGLAETEFALVRFHGDKKAADAVYEGTKPMTGHDIAQTVLWALTQPAHVNINRIELMATCQAFSPFAIHREPK
ncbi:MAG: SDR family NAD(P)-dependent oxidoreductase, partial [Proteobacteria bacterium]|nr:SDR family NAD(P)-dependent oxidoreductase [Pseudomonadota bacterium]